MLAATHPVRLCPEHQWEVPSPALNAEEQALALRAAAEGQLLVWALSVEGRAFTLRRSKAAALADARQMDREEFGIFEGSHCECLHEVQVSPMLVE